MFNNLTGLYALFFIIPFILIYMIRPKSFERVIPSLMFMMQEKNKFKKASFLQKLLRNLLLLIQLLAILFLAFSVASPYLEIPHTIMVRNHVLVLDTSASMQTRDGAGTRFTKAVSNAKDNLGMRNTVILAENTPIIVLEDATSGETLGLLDKLTPKATSTNLGDAVLLAEDLLGNKKGVVTVISDFITTEGSDLLMAKRSLESKGNTVDFVDVGNKADNIGITDLVVGKDETTVEIKNYKDKDETVKATLSSDRGETSKKEINLMANSKEKIIFETPKGVSKISLDVNDDLPVDNTAYISSPEKGDVRALLITSEPEGNKIKAALSALKINLEIREPPTVNAYNVDHDVVIMDNINKELFVPTDLNDLKKYAGKGGILVIAAQDNIAEIDKLGLLPVVIKSMEGKPTTVCADMIGGIFPKDPFAEEPCFTQTSTYLKGTAKNGSITLASTQLDNSPVIVTMKQGEGDIFYYGIMDKYSGFYSDPFYPVFWNNVLNYLMKAEDISEYNYKGGRLLVINEQEVKTPSAKLTTNKLLLDEAGIYEFNGKKAAVNLVNEAESDISRETVEFKKELEKFSSEKVKDFDNIDLEVPLLIAAIALLFIEFLYVKRRGDL